MPHAPPPFLDHLKILRSTAESERDGEDFVVKLETLKRGSSFGEAELLASAEAEEGLAAAAAALKHRQNSQKSERLKSMGRARADQQQQAKEPVGMLVSAAGVSAEVKPTAIAVEKSLPPRKRTPGEEYGRGPARGAGVARAVRAVCVSEEDCEVMAVPRHLFANLLDELGGVRRKLEDQVSEAGINESINQFSFVSLSLSLALVVENIRSN